MKKCVWFNHVLICSVMGLLVGCTDEEDGGTFGNGSVSGNEAEVKMLVDVGRDSLVKLWLDGEEMPNLRGAYVSQFLTDYETIPYPEDLVINWGDGTETRSNIHQYAVGGFYQITLRCKGLRSLYTDADVKELDLSQAVDLEYLCLEGSRASIKKLDTGRNKKLKYLNTYYADAIHVDVSYNTDLMYLACNYFEGKPGGLDFSKNTKLRYLKFSCEGNENKPDSLNIKGCDELIYLSVDKADFSDEVANRIYNDLPRGRSWEYEYREYSSYVDLGYKWEDNTYVSIGDVSIAEQKGWISGEEENGNRG